MLKYSLQAFQMLLELEDAPWCVYCEPLSEESATSGIELAAAVTVIKLARATENVLT